MTHNELAELLDADLVVNVGQEPKSNRVHKLFYSIKDNICFVAIQDVKTGTVITVLPVDYHETICWAVSLDAVSQARRLVTREESRPESIKVLKTNATVFRIAGYFLDDQGKYLKSVGLGSWPCFPYHYSVEALIEDYQFLNYLVGRIKGRLEYIKEFGFMDMQKIAVCIGKHGVPVFFSTSELIESYAKRKCIERP